MKEKLEKIAKKYCEIDYNKDNFSIGGGVVSDKFASRRHEEALNDDGKKTQGQVATLFKRATGLETWLINAIINENFELEWHHAGKLPKQYGGGMKKTYFMNSKQICELATKFVEFANFQIEKRNSYSDKKLELIQL